MSGSPSNKRHHDMNHDPRRRAASEDPRKRARDSSLPYSRYNHVYNLRDKVKSTKPTIFYHDLGGLYGADAGTVTNGPLSFMQGNPLLNENKQVEIKKRLDYAKVATYGQYVAPQDFTSYYRNFVVPVLPRIL